MRVTNLLSRFQFPVYTVALLSPRVSTVRTKMLHIKEEL